MSSICHIHGQASLPAIDVVQNAYDDLGLTQTVDTAGSEWTRTVAQTLGIEHDFSDFYGETVASTMTLVSSFDGDRDLNLSESDAIIFVQTTSVAGGRVGGGGAGDIVSTFSITYDSGGPTSLDGQVVYIDSADDEAKLATNATEALAEAAGFIVTGQAAGLVVDVVTEGDFTLADWTTIAGTEFLTAGATYYLGTGGGIVVTPPITGSVVVLGRAMTPTKLDIEINTPWVL